MQRLAIAILFLIFCTLHNASPINRVDQLTARLANAFQRLVVSPESTVKKTEFSSELSNEIISFLNGFSPQLVSTTVDEQANNAAEVEDIPNPDTDMCERDYSKMCPEFWIDLGDASHCLAPGLYEGPCDQKLYVMDFSPIMKFQLAQKCGSPWPCKVECEQDTSQLCPENWTVRNNSICNAPDEYRGECVRLKSFSNFDDEMKKKWAKECGVKWSCKLYDRPSEGLKCPDGWSLNEGICIGPGTYLGPCSSEIPLNEFTDKNKHKLTERCHVYWKESSAKSSICPEGWKLDSTECFPPPYYSGSCSKIDIANITTHSKTSIEKRCDVSWSSFFPHYNDQIYRPSFQTPCPLFWNMENGVCVASTSYNGPCELRPSFTGYTEEMKAAWANRCKVTWSLPEKVGNGSTVRLGVFDAVAKRFTNGQGPISPFSGKILLPNGFVYFPSTQGTTSTLPIIPNTSYSSAIAVQKHISELKDKEKKINDPHMANAIQQAIDMLQARGDAPIKFQFSFLQKKKKKKKGKSYSYPLKPVVLDEEIVKLLSVYKSLDICPPDYRACPLGWISYSSTTCVAPDTYISSGGRCGPSLDLLDYSYRLPDGTRALMKEDLRVWAMSCNVKFPCLTCDRDYVTFQCPLGWQITSGGMCQAPSPSHSCETEWPCYGTCLHDYSNSSLNGFMMEENSTPVRASEQEARSERKDAEAIRNIEMACLGRCEQDVTSQPCPHGWKFSRRKLLCESPDYYSPPVGCGEKISLKGVSYDELKNVGIRCNAPWPCKGSCDRNYRGTCPKGWHRKWGFDRRKVLCVPPKHNSGFCHGRYYDLTRLSA